MPQLGIEVLRKIFEVAYEEKHSGKAAKHYKAFFLAVAKSEPSSKRYLEVLNELFNKPQGDTATRIKWISNCQKRRREINKTFEKAFGQDVIQIGLKRAYAWQLVIRGDFRQNLQDKSSTEVQQFLRNWRDNKDKEQPVRAFGPYEAGSSGQAGTKNGQAVLQFLNNTFSECVLGLKGTPYGLDGLLLNADESVLIVGQNLHFLVRDEIKSAKKDTDIVGNFGTRLTNWLHEKEGRTVKIFILDLRAESVVLNRARQSQSIKTFIDDLCDATARYRMWQDEIDSENFTVRIVNTLPPSLVAVDADNPDKGIMAVTPCSYGLETEKRPTLVVRRGRSPERFERLYEPYGSNLGLKHTSNVTDISPADISKCRKLRNQLA